tara:strand:+ start:1215 stop:1340 length:126 start_codon:yes stop_codon:yes gene_type:complete
MTLTEKQKELLRDRDRQYFDLDQMDLDHLENNLLIDKIGDD